MFTSNDFAVFAAPTLSARMALIRQQLDPKFTQAAQSIVPVLQTPNQPIFAHIAQHRRRHKNPPPNTWVAFSTSRRGYKMLPHLALGFGMTGCFCGCPVCAKVNLYRMIFQVSLMLFRHYLTVGYWLVSIQQRQLCR